jgi:hypothetical protein
MMRSFGRAVRDDHLSEWQSVKQWPNLAPIGVSNCANDETLAVVEADVHLPILPPQHVPFHPKIFAVGCMEKQL